MGNGLVGNDPFNKWVKFVSALKIRHAFHPAAGVLRQLSSSFKIVENFEEKNAENQLACRPIQAKYDSSPNHTIDSQSSRVKSKSNCSTC